MFYKIVFFPSEEKTTIANNLNNLLNKSGFKETEEDQAEYIFVIGGDGSFIHFSREYAFKSKKIIWIRSGTLSFLSSLTVEQLNLENLQFEPVELLSIKTPSNTFYCFNDFYISGELLLEVEIYIDNHFLESFKGSALLISTQTGSTGKNKSLGGPILPPNSNLWLINEVGSHNTNINRSLNCPLVLTPSNKLKIKIPELNNCNTYIDGQPKDKLTNLSLEITFIKGNSKIVKYFWDDYINRLRKTFLKNNV